METLPSRAWSCSELLDGAAMLTDDAVVAYKKNLLSETHGKSGEELERLLQDWVCCSIHVKNTQLDILRTLMRQLLSILVPMSWIPSCPDFTSGI